MEFGICGGEKEAAGGTQPFLNFARSITDIEFSHIKVQLQQRAVAFVCLLTVMRLCERIHVFWN